MLRISAWLLVGLASALVVVALVGHDAEDSAPPDRSSAAPSSNMPAAGNGAPSGTGLERSALATLDEGGPTPIRQDREAPRFDSNPEALPAPPTSEQPLGTSEVSPQNPTPLGTGLVRSEIGQQQIRRLVDGGFAAYRAEQIVRYEELRMEMLEAQDAAWRTGQPVDLNEIAGQVRLRRELGDEEYERYLRALGRPTDVPVRDVLTGSAAEAAGVQPGDRIVGYAGTRVFDARGLDALTLEGRRGEPVVVDVRRDGMLIQVVVPRGALGIVGGGAARAGRAPPPRRAQP